MSAPPLPHGTGVRDASVQFPTGRWPDQIAYSLRDVYLYSVNPSPQIEALDHVHVVNFDLDVSAPYTMTLTLPVMNRLPSKSRFYFFYVSRCHDGDTLTFSPVSLSGDTVNGIAGPHSFTLTGDKLLFVCIGVKQNYIIHPIPTTVPVIPPTPVAAPNPTIMYRALPRDGQLDTPFAIGAPISDATYNLLRYCSYAFNPVPDPLMHIPGMDGYITYAKPLPGYARAGFVVNHPGIYRVTYTTSGIYWIPNAGGPLINKEGNGLLAIFPAGGGDSPTDWAPFGTKCSTAVAPAPAPASMFSGSVSRVFRLLAGDQILGSLAVDADVAVGGIGEWGGITDLSTYTFELIQDLAPPPAPLALASLRSFGPAAAGLSAPPSASLAPEINPNEIVMGSKSDNAASRLALHKQQVQTAKDAAARQVSFSSSYPQSSSSSSQQQPQYGLSDLEAIVRQIMRVQQSQVPEIEQQELSSSSNAAGKKRVRQQADVAFIEPPAKK